MARDLQNLCDRLNDVFNADDDTPDELCQEAREAIEELWQHRDAPKDELAWLVERDSPAEYAYMDDMGIQWTGDPNKAMRFARRDDAEMFAAGSDDAVRVCEHMWCSPPTTTGQTP